MMPKIIPCLWFEKEAEEAANYYVSVFSSIGREGKVGKILYHDEASSKENGLPKGSVLTVEFSLDGMQFVALNGRPPIKFNMAISLMIYCKTQKEIDHFWNRLTAGGKEIQCGWIEDKYGLSWQIVPEIWSKLIGDPDPVKSGRAMKAMLVMKKLDIQKLKDAHDGK